MIPYLEVNCSCQGRLRSLDYDRGGMYTLRCIVCEERRELPRAFQERFDLFGGENPWVEFEMKQLGVQKR